ncbi:unnamed protein product [Ambrosiozyma monospora]|uniref:Unnamed protein product n=1 Tax=Ambrosiozyma monospora TaxID=43982 RepID=A0A9W7DE52_AMBMO|nr:unnamed protein product [Ambrosiozyma monospora]
MSQLISTAIEITKHYQPSPLRMRLSSIAGSTSLACWFVVILPQLIEQWRLKSVDGISPTFLLIWASGDFANLVGSLSAGLLPEVILTALWFFLSDGFVLFFYIYIGYIYPKRHGVHHGKHGSGKKKHHHPHQLPNQVQDQVQQENDEQTPLISETETTTSPLEQTRSRSSRNSNLKSRSRKNSSTLDSFALKPSQHSILLRYVLPIVFILMCGIIGSFCSPNGSQAGDGDGDGDGNVGEPDNGQDKFETFPQICGYISAVLYLTARLPQIYRNYTKKSCKGLSLLFFMLSTLGNVTYGLQILLYRSDWDYVMLNLSWLLGSLGTIVEDFVIFYQFYIYGGDEDVECDEDGAVVDVEDV